MPYILNEQRSQYSAQIQSLTDKLLKTETDPGHLNYVISKLLKNLLTARLSYSEANKLMGVLECVKHELYRRYIGPYEDQKIEQNGDI